MKDIVKYKVKVLTPAFMLKIDEFCNMRIQSTRFDNRRDIIFFLRELWQDRRVYLPSDPIKSSFHTFDSGLHQEHMQYFIDNQVLVPEFTEEIMDCKEITVDAIGPMNILLVYMNCRYMETGTIENCFDYEKIG
jgi:hypothetical protein